MFSYRYFILNSFREVRFSLQKIIGLGFRKTFFICAKVGLAFPFSLYNLSFYFFSVIIFLVKFFAKTDVTVNRMRSIRLSPFMKVGQLRAAKNRDFLPVNGQRTRTNCGVRKRLKIAHFAAIEARRKAEEEAKKKKEKKEKKDKKEKKIKKEKEKKVG
jgi:ribosomal protein S13